jgi:hypothetical protein
MQGIRELITGKSAVTIHFRKAEKAGREVLGPSGTKANQQT